MNRSRPSISTTGSLTEWLTKRIGTAEGWGPDAIRRVAIGDAVQQTAALRAGQVDGLMGAMENGYQLEERHEGRVIVSMDKYVPHFVTHVIFARKDFAAGDPDATKRFLQGFFVTLHWIKDHKKESLTIVQPPVPKPAPVGVGGRKDGDDGDSVDDTGALDTPPVEPDDA